MNTKSLLSTTFFRKLLPSQYTIQIIVNICPSQSCYISCYKDKKSSIYFLFNCPFNCPFKCPFNCPVITYGHKNEKCENKYTICLKLYTFKVQPVINLSTFENQKKTFFIANYSNFNFQNRGFSIKKNSFFSCLRRAFTSMILVTVEFVLNTPPPG